MALNFDNTEVAFSYLSDQELKKAYYIFNLLNNNFLSNIGKSVTMKAFDAGLPIKGLVKKTIFNAFVGGETLPESEPEISLLHKHNIGVILDYGIEAKNEEKDLDAIADVIAGVAKQVHDEKTDHVEVCAKLSAFAKNELLAKVSAGEKLTTEEEGLWERVKNRIDRVSKTAHNHDVCIYYDAEESWLQIAIDDLCEQMMEKYNKEKPIVYTTIQLYRHDKLEYLKELHQRAVEKGYILAVKLVRGAYMEKERQRAQEMGYESPIQPTKAATDADYNRAVEYCVEHIDEIAMCMGTHNEESNYFLDELLQHRDIPKSHNHIITAQLFGMGDHLTFNMAKEGYNAKKYLPYGPVEELLPYLLRRAQENTSVDGQASRELNLLKKEIKRRGLKVMF